LFLMKQFFPFLRSIPMQELDFDLKFIAFTPLS